MVTHWTTAAYQDHFVRNLITMVPASLRAEVESVPFVPNPETMPTWPSYPEAERWIMSRGPSNVDEFKIQTALDAAIWQLSARTETFVRPVDANGDFDPGAAPVEISPTLFMAVLLQTNRWYRRKDTPDGVMGSSEFEGMVRVSGIDPDIEAMLWGGGDLSFTIG